MTIDSAETRRCVSNAVQRLGEQPGPLLEILHAVQDELGCIPAEVVPLLAEALNLSRAEVHGVISFYHHFRSEAPGRTVVQVCRAEACQSMNGNVLADEVRRKLGVDFGETRPDGLVTLEAVYCLGNCACAPSMMVNGNLLGRVDPKSVEDLAVSWGVSR